MSLFVRDIYDPWNGCRLQPSQFTYYTILFTSIYSFQIYVSNLQSSTSIGFSPFVSIYSFINYFLIYFLTQSFHIRLSLGGQFAVSYHFNLSIYSFFMNLFLTARWPLIFHLLNRFNCTAYLLACHINISEVSGSNGIIYL